MIDEKVLMVVVFALLSEETGEFLDSKSTYPPPPMCTYAVATELTLNFIFTFLLRVVGSGGEKQN